MSETEHSATFACFGAHCSVHVSGGEDAREAVTAAREALLAWHERFSRFLPASELSRLNSDPRRAVPASPLMVRLAAAVREAGTLSGGLVDGTLVGALERAGYAGELGEPLPLARALALAPPRRPALADPARRWEQVEADPETGVVRRPPGIELDSGGLAKGLFADVLAERLGGHASFAIDCAGDVRLGGRARRPRTIHVQSPLDGSVLHTFRSPSCGVATSGIGRRSWLDGRGRPAHHLLDPGRGQPAFTGIIQATALADTALRAEVLAKAALLSGPAGAERWLAQGGVIVLEDGSHRVIEPGRAPSTTHTGGSRARVRTTAAAGSRAAA